ncbi:MAG: prenyltransferase [Planctomycetes bacterium]|nr:prenyltransferase [Planctomycetota bacterium]
MGKLKAYLGIARGPFLLLPVALVASGASAEALEGRFDWLHTAVALAGLLALHAAVNIFNEASDMRSGIDLRTERTPFSGGSGTLPSGALTVRQATRFGLVCSGIGVAIGLWFVALFGWVLVPILLAGGLFVFGYTGLLARLGVGEIAAGLGLGTLPVLGAALVQEGTLGSAAIAASIPAFFMTFNLLLLNEFPDEAADRWGGRRNLVTLLGRRRAALVYAAAVLATPASLGVAVVLGALPPACLIAAAPALLLIPALRWSLSRAREAVPLPALGGNVAWNLLTHAALTLALIGSMWMESRSGQI